MSLPAPFVSEVMDIEKAWIDYNGHMNMAFYIVLFDRASDGGFELVGLGPDYVKERAHTFYTAEAHICYVQELHLGDRVTVSFQLLDYDEKRVRAYEEIRHVDGWLAATIETLSLHIDMSGPKVAPFPADILSRLEALKAAHAVLPTPERAGRSIGIKRKTT